MAAFSRDADQASVIEAVRALFPRFASRVETAERDRCIPRESMDELHDAGFFKWFVPKRYGGFEWMPTDAYEVAIEMGTVCTSTAWVALLLSIHNHLIGQMDSRAQDEVWSKSPETLASSSFAPVGSARSVTGGFELTGHWPFSSGVDYCEWAIVASNVNGDPKQGTFFLVSDKQYAINDNWHVAGMKATGSKELVLDHAFVPGYRAIDFRSVHRSETPGLKVNNTPLYWIPFRPLFTWVICVHAFGPAISAREEYIKATRRRVGAYTGDKLSERQLAMARLAEASAEIDAAHLIFKRDFAEMEQAGNERRRMDPLSFSRSRFDAVYALELCGRAFDRLWRASGAHALFESSALQRNLRDIHAMSQHGGADFDAALADYGRSLLDVKRRA